jgi:hypothetical protein
VFIILEALDIIENNTSHFDIICNSKLEKIKIRVRNILDFCIWITPVPLSGVEHSMID